MRLESFFIRRYSRSFKVGRGSRVWSTEMNDFSLTWGKSLAQEFNHLNEASRLAADLVSFRNEDTLDSSSVESLDEPNTVEG